MQLLMRALVKIPVSGSFFMTYKDKQTSDSKAAHIICPRCKGSGGTWWPDGKAGHGCGPEFEKCNGCDGQGRVTADMTRPIQRYDRRQIRYSIFRMCILSGFVIGGIAVGIYLVDRYRDVIDTSGYMTLWGLVGGVIGFIFGLFVLRVLLRFLPSQA